MDFTTGAAGVVLLGVLSLVESTLYSVYAGSEPVFSLTPVLGSMVMAHAEKSLRSAAQTNFLSIGLYVMACL